MSYCGEARSLSGKEGTYELLGLLLLLVEVGGREGLALVLQALDNGVILPAELGTEAGQHGVAARWVEALDTEGVGDNDALDLVVRGRDSLEDFEAGESLGSALGLVGQHAADGAPEDLAGGAVVDEATAGVGADVLAQEKGEAV